MISNTLLDALLTFRRERDWEQFHTVRNLSSALCVEAAELLDLFRWARDSEITAIAEQERSEIESEVADVTIILMYLCHDLDISLEKVVRKKLEVNREKYPVENSKGTSKKYNRLK
ncbi:MAG: nucleotide pyrophosphohydrolase [Syntrophales bacterium]|jgi:NTP pyrophosphatase (non-canonical NTP hydrolase)|nr:nucleotide pyrophosphohydrolase [Syntrophales bacterium]